MGHRYQCIKQTLLTRQVRLPEAPAPAGGGGSPAWTGAAAALQQPAAASFEALGALAFDVLAVVCAGEGAIGSAGAARVKDPIKVSALKERCLVSISGTPIC